MKGQYAFRWVTHALLRKHYPYQSWASRGPIVSCEVHGGDPQHACLMSSRCCYDYGIVMIINIQVSTGHYTASSNSCQTEQLRAMTYKLQPCAAASGVRSRHLPSFNLTRNFRQMFRFSRQTSPILGFFNRLPKFRQRNSKFRRKFPVGSK